MARKTIKMKIGGRIVASFEDLAAVEERKLRKIQGYRLLRTGTPITASDALREGLTALLEHEQQLIKDKENVKSETV
jgi:hypothetical protein